MTDAICSLINSAWYRKIITTCSLHAVSSKHATLRWWTKDGERFDDILKSENTNMVFLNISKLYGNVSNNFKTY